MIKQINYNKMLEKTTDVFKGISDENFDFAKEFVSSDNKDKKRELNNLLNDNGINEKNPFDTDVITNAVNISFEIYKKELQIYLDAYDKTNKLLNELSEDDVKVDKHRKFLNDSKAKLDFLFAEKYYIVGFLDNERIAAIYDKKLHRKLMLEACRNFNSDLEHINSLYEIILKEVISRSSKRLCKDNYNRKYLVDIERSSEKVQEETNKLKANAIAVMNLNYWRIDGISRIQEVFETDMKEIYGKDVDEIIPKERAEGKIDETDNDSMEKFTVENIIEKAEINKKRTIKNVARKIDIKNLLSSDEIIKNSSKIQENLEIISGKEKSNEVQVDEVSDIQTDKDIDIDEIDELNEEQEDILDSTLNEEDDTSLFEKISQLDDLDGLDDILADNQEESILDFCLKKSEEENIEAFKSEMKQKNKKNGIFKKLIGINSKNKQEA